MIPLLSAGRDSVLQTTTTSIGLLVYYIMHPLTLGIDDLLT